MTDAETNLNPRNIPMTVHSQYIKDVSFENPGAPEAFRSSSGKPNMNVTINVGVEDISTDTYPGVFEVTLRVRAHAKRDEKTAFIAEVQYAACVSFPPDTPENARHPMLMIDVPRLLFPFARMILSDLSQNGGYPVMLISLIDFQALYVQKFANEIEQLEKVEPKTKKK